MAKCHTAFSLVLTLGVIVGTALTEIRKDNHQLANSDGLIPQVSQNEHYQKESLSSDEGKELGNNEGDDGLLNRMNRREFSRL
jgi:hypothetical protein